jgi:hypothetical protein
LYDFFTELKPPGGIRVNEKAQENSEKAQGNFIWAIGAGIVLDVAIDVIRDIAFEIRTGGTDLPFRYGLVDWRTSVSRRLFSSHYRS